MVEMSIVEKLLIERHAFADEIEWHSESSKQEDNHTKSKQKQLHATFQRQISFSINTKSQCWSLSYSLWRMILLLIKKLHLISID